MQHPDEILGNNKDYHNFPTSHIQRTAHQASPPSSVPQLRHEFLHTCKTQKIMIWSTYQSLKKHRWKSQALPMAGTKHTRLLPSALPLPYAPLKLGCTLQGYKALACEMNQSNPTRKYLETQAWTSISSQTRTKPFANPKPPHIRPKINAHTAHPRSSLASSRPPPAATYPYGIPYCGKHA